MQKLQFIKLDTEEQQMANPNLHRTSAFVSFFID